MFTPLETVPRRFKALHAVHAIANKLAQLQRNFNYVQIISQSVSTIRIVSHRCIPFQSAAIHFIPFHVRDSV
eukprot:2885109-Alexandrium_andersonii.AAC.1